MNRYQFKKYQLNFERKLISNGLQALAKPEMVAIRPGVMAKSKFAVLMGHAIRTDVPAAIDYYGHFKKSTGFFSVMEEFQRDHPGSQVRMMRARVVHFASIRVEDLFNFAPELVSGFPEFKLMLLKARGFAHGG